MSSGGFSFFSSLPEPSPCSAFCQMRGLWGLFYDVKVGNTRSLLLLLAIIIFSITLLLINTRISPCPILVSFQKLKKKSRSHPDFFILKMPNRINPEKMRRGLLSTLCPSILMGKPAQGATGTTRTLGLSSEGGRKIE